VELAGAACGTPRSAKMLTCYLDFLEQELALDGRRLDSHCASALIGGATDDLLDGEPERKTQSHEIFHE
jgi:hypothetical protein